MRTAFEKPTAGQASSSKDQSTGNVSTIRQADRGNGRPSYRNVRESRRVERSEQVNKRSCANSIGPPGRVIPIMGRARRGVDGVALLAIPMGISSKLRNHERA